MGPTRHRFFLLTTVSREVGLRGISFFYDAVSSCWCSSALEQDFSAPQPNLSGNGSQEGESVSQRGKDVIESVNRFLMDWDWDATGERDARTRRRRRRR